MFFSVFLISGFISPAFASTVTCSPSPCIVFDYQADPDPPNGYFVGHEAIINITDAGAVSAGITDITAHIISSSASPPNNDLTFPLHYTPDTANPNTFVSVWINFTTNTFDSTKYILPVAAGGTVRVTYTNATDQTANIFNPNPDPVPTSWGAQPNVTTKPSCSTAGGDTDGDSLCDNWEDQGLLGGKLVITYNTATFKYYCSRDNQTVTNPTMPLGTLANPDTVCPDKDHKDVFVEVDWMKHHKPHPQTIAALIQAFKNAPVGPSGVTCPGDSRCGINLHLQLDNYTIHRDYTSAPSNGANSITRTNFDKIKMKYFGLSSEQGNADLLTAKRFAFHYALFTHFQTNAKSSSGKSELPGNDLVISLGAFTGARGSPDEQSGTLMHELGHNMQLDHGGPTRIPPTNPTYNVADSSANCKPNYLSVMSWSRQLPAPVSDRALNYSSGFLGSLNKNSLIEQDNVTSSVITKQRIVYGPDPVRFSKIPNPGGPKTSLDWNRNNIDDGATGVAANINNMASLGCNDDQNTNVSLSDHDDWSNLLFDMTGTSSWYDGANRVGVIISGSDQINYVEPTDSQLKLVQLSEELQADIVKNVIKKHYLVKTIDPYDADKITNTTEILVQATEYNKTNPFWFPPEPAKLWIPMPKDNYTVHEDVSLESFIAFHSLAIRSIQNSIKELPASDFTYPDNKTALLNKLASADSNVKENAFYAAKNDLFAARYIVDKSISNEEKRSGLLDDIDYRILGIDKTVGTLPNGKVIVKNKQGSD